MKVYVVWDGRAIDDPDEAAVLEYMGKMPEHIAIKQWMESWGGTHSVLMSYDMEEDELINEELVMVTE